MSEICKFASFYVQFLLTARKIFPISNPKNDLHLFGWVELRNFDSAHDDAAVASLWTRRLISSHQHAPFHPDLDAPKVTILSGEGKTEWLAEGGELKPHLRWSRKAKEEAEALIEMKKRETGVEEDPKQRHIVHSAVCTAIVITISTWSFLAQEVTPRTRREW
ncbi:hypothetical protein ECG_03594 [Echinococcus granulosus]|nr:hypothetical protein ECG_03594 [Echinococcus granulosus]